MLEVGPCLHLGWVHLTVILVLQQHVHKGGQSLVEVLGEGGREGGREGGEGREGREGGSEEGRGGEGGEEGRDLIMAAEYSRRVQRLTFSPTIFIYVSTALVAKVLPLKIRFSFSAQKRHTTFNEVSVLWQTCDPYLCS